MFVITYSGGSNPGANGPNAERRLTSEVWVYSLHSFILWIVVFHILATEVISLGFGDDHHDF